MQKKMGENIALEWERDPHAGEVWDALQLTKTDPQKGISTLLTLGENESALALTFAGSAYAYGANNTRKNEAVAIRLLEKSLELGSIEGGYILAYLQISTSRLKRGLETYYKLANMGYSPAMYALGHYFVYGSPEIRNHDKGIELFERAAHLGHFYAKRELANFLIRQKTTSGIFKGYYTKLSALIPYLWTRSRYPNSDRLRT